MKTVVQELKGFDILFQKYWKKPNFEKFCLKFTFRIIKNDRYPVYNYHYFD